LPHGTQGSARLGTETKVRYAIVGAGDIAQEDMMPGVAHTGNSVLTAIVTGDRVKARALGERYDVAATFDSTQWDEALRSGTFDAVYIATPNWKHPGAEGRHPRHVREAARGDHRALPADHGGEP
jgi:hypothetical protein